MSRAIVAAAPVSGGVGTRGGLDDDGPSAPPAQPDDYGDKLLKLIPAEVVGGYMSLISVLDGSEEVAHLELLCRQVVYWMVLVAGFLATYFLMRFGFKVRDKRQIVVTLIAFLVWAYTLGGPFEISGVHSNTASGVLLTLFTFTVPKIPMGERR